MDLWNTSHWRPLAERRRPQKLEDILGHEELCGQEGILTLGLKKGQVNSLILWGPPGCGKTTLGKLLARESGCHFEFFSAATDGLKELKNIVAQARDIQKLEGRSTLLFCDEIHRLNKGQQDAFLPHVESGLLILVGATTENPSFEINGALLSRCRVFSLKPLTSSVIRQIMLKALEEDFELTSSGLKLSEACLDLMASLADGDARQALNFLETLIPFADQEHEPQKILELLHKPLAFDKQGEAHYNLISCLHKSVRASDVQAAVYYCVRMVEAGEDLKYLARRLMRMALEDVGLADPQALVQATATLQAVTFIGAPESHLALVQLAVYLATAPKSNSVYLAEKGAQKTLRQTGNLAPPMTILNAPTSLMKEMGYGRGYRYDHDENYHFSGAQCLPEAIQGHIFYQPGEFGFEKEIDRRLQWWKDLRQQKQDRSKNQ